MAYNRPMTNPNPSSIAQTDNRFPSDEPTDLAAEFHAWELASDEALENFEKGLEIPEQFI